jgi:uncharacterized protein YndB with AHSA1/START domain
MPDFRYITYITASAERVWDALTSERLTAEYWGHANVSDWQVDSRWQHVRTDGSGIADVVGTVTESQRPARLVMTFDDPDSPPSLVTFEIEQWRDIVKVTISHDDLPSEEDATIAELGWAGVAANLKSLLETGRTMPQPPWELDAR